MVLLHFVLEKFNKSFLFENNVQLVDLIFLKP